MKPLRKIVQDGCEILVIDFSNLKEDQMITLLSDSRRLLIEEKRPQKLLAIFNHKNYITGKVLRHFETDQLEAINYSAKLVVVGLSTTQKMILKGYNAIFNRAIKSFDTQEDAMRFLLDDGVKK